MGIPERVIEELRGRVLLSDLVQRSGVELRRAGATWKACCPFHNEKTPSFVVDDGKRRFNCYGCGAHGDALDWLQQRHGLDFVAAARELGRMAGVDVESHLDAGGSRSPEEKAQAKRQRDQRRQREAWMLRANEAAALWFSSNLWNGALYDPMRPDDFPAQQQEAAKALAYLMERGFSDETIREWGIGFAPSEGGLLDHLVRLGGKRRIGAEKMRKCAIAAGLAGKSESGFVYERFKDRVMFPIENARGRVVGFGGRILDYAEAEAKEAGRRKPPKYKNTPETPLFQKHGLLYGLHRALPAIRQKGHAALCEGYTDVISAHAAGRCHFVATLGTAFTEDHAKALRGITSTVVGHFDNDDAGRKAALAAVRVCGRAGIAFRVASATDGAKTAEKGN